MKNLKPHKVEYRIFQHGQFGPWQKSSIGTKRKRQILLTGYAHETEGLYRIDLRKKVCEPEFFEDIRFLN